MHRSDIDTSELPEAIGQRVATHWNLQKQTYSIKQSGRPVFYAPQLRLVECTFVIDHRLRAMFEAKPSRRTVHALIRGRLVGYAAATIDGELVRCNPFLFDSFVRASDQAPVISADEVVLHPDRRIEARGLRAA
jgi:hypothetical protein